MHRKTFAALCIYFKKLMISYVRHATPCLVSPQLVHLSNWPYIITNELTLVFSFNKSELLILLLAANHMLRSGRNLMYPGLKVLC